MLPKLLTVILIGLVTPSEITAQGPPQGGYTYGLIGYTNKRCLTVNGGSMKDKAAVDQWTCYNQDNQLWIMKRPNGYSNPNIFQYVNKRSGKCLTAGGLDNGSPIYQDACLTILPYNQMWTVDFNSHLPLNGTYFSGQSPYYRITGVGVKCLTYEGDGQGARMYLNDCSYLFKNQYFSFYPSI